MIQNYGMTVQENALEELCCKQVQLAAKAQPLLQAPVSVPLIAAVAGSSSKSYKNSTLPLNEFALKKYIN